MLSALVLGGADGVWAQLAKAQALGPFDLVVACNHAGRDYPGALDHWATFHTEHLARWIKARHLAHRPAAGQLWSVVNRPAPAGFTWPLQRLPNWGGSSGLLAVQVALHLGATHVVLCGIPMDSQAHYDRPGQWNESRAYRNAWEARRTEMRGVRSWDGWTRKLLGEPSQEWFNAHGNGDDGGGGGAAEHEGRGRA